MYKIAVTILLIFVFRMENNDASFRQNQKKFDRVKNAYAIKESAVQSLFTKSKLDYNSFDLFIRAFKSENILQVFTKGKQETKYKLLTEYKFCTLSGELGPKRKQGDMQVPEGFYHIDRFNPLSNFYLSLGINYPNSSDKILGNKVNPGGDIFIHGNCVSIGCIPITDEKIMELYILCVEARAGGQKSIPVHIFPSKLDGTGMATLEKSFDQALVNFWKGLKPGYELFETNLTLPEIKVDPKGNYSFE